MLGSYPKVAKNLNLHEINTIQHGLKNLFLICYTLPILTTSNKSYMKKFKLIITAALLSSTLFLTSCSNQMYGYRQKVKVDQSVAKAEKQDASKEIVSKKSEMPATALVAPESLEPKAHSSAPSPLVIAPKVKSNSSKAFSQTQMVKTFKSKKAELKAEVKALKQKLEPKEKNGVSVDGVRWMIVGLILMLAGWILLALIGGAVFSIIGTIGSIIFIVGLIFWLIEVLA
jgi:predicted small secreted protein